MLQTHKQGIEFRLVTPDLEIPLAKFFQAILAHRLDEFFHPHPFTADEARRKALYEGSDLYYVILEGADVLGYGCLRGWDEGYDVPSLGIAIHPTSQSQGLGRTFMSFLHLAAKRKGARRVRLKVHAANDSALALYRSLGYQFEDNNGRQPIGIFDLY